MTFFFSSRRRHTRFKCDWSSDVCSSDLMMGGYMLIRPDQKAGEAVHILFVGEKSKSTQSFPHPDLHPEEKHLFGLTVPVAPLKDLLQMKLTSFRPRDVAHLEILDELGLITP